MRPSDAKEVLKAMFRMRRPILLSGMPGVGKTSIVVQACESIGMKYVLFHPAVSEPTDFKGYPFVVDGQALFLPFGDLKILLDAQEPIVAFMDDFGQGPASTQAAIMQLLGSRRLNDHVISDNVTFVLATNRKQDKANVRGILEPVKSRCITIIEVTPNLDDWCEWMIKNNKSPEVVAFIRWRPEFLEKFKPTNDMTNSPCPRTLANAADLVANPDIPRNCLFEVLAGAAGEAFAAEFTGFLKVYQNLPDLDKMLLMPDQAHIPTDEVGVLYAIAVGLGVRANKRNFKNYTKLLSKMPDEMAVTSIRTAVSKTPDLVETKEYMEGWGRQFAEKMYSDD